jgi:ubiquinone/menaquinone biosynthesis C-methylase UbiE
MSQENTAVYTHGHHESVLRSHSWRTADNSAQYLLKHLTPDMHILDVGCGPGTITADLALLVPQGKVVGLETGPEILEKAKDFADKRGITNIQFSVGDVCNLGYPDHTFDVVHAHQVLQHLGDPVQALREMHRVTKPGGIIAARDTDFEAMTWYPEHQGLFDWRKLYLQVARSNGGEPKAGRRLHVWAHQAGIERSNIICSVGTWCYRTPEERHWWANSWADRTLSSGFALSALEKGYANQQELERIAQVWRDWGKDDDAWFAILHGEILCRV